MFKPFKSAENKPDPIKRAMHRDTRQAIVKDRRNSKRELKQMVSR